MTAPGPAGRSGAGLPAGGPGKPNRLEMQSPFALSERLVQDGRGLIAVKGELDLFTAPDLRTKINDSIDAGVRELIVDLSETAFLDSTALGVLLGALKRLRSFEGQLVIVDGRDNITRTFRVAGVDQILTIVNSYEEAAAAFAATA
jgi:anti-sigma B factor antagonist